MKLYVGNLSYNATEADLQQAFEAFGRVESVALITDKYSGESKGFGFVEMPNSAEAKAAIDGLNDKEFKGRTLTVNEARPRPEGGRPGHGKGGHGGRGGGGGGRGGRRPF